MKIQQAPAWWFGAAQPKSLPTPVPPTAPGSLPSLLQHTAWIATLPKPDAAPAEGEQAVPATVTTHALSPAAAQLLLGSAKAGETPTFLQSLAKALEPSQQAHKIIKQISDSATVQQSGVVVLPSEAARTAFECVGLGFDSLKFGLAVETAAREKTAYSVADAMVAFGKVTVNAGKVLGYDTGYLAYVVGVGGYVMKVWKAARDVGPGTTAATAIVVTPLRPLTFTPIHPLVNAATQPTANWVSLAGALPVPPDGLKAAYEQHLKPTG